MIILFFLRIKAVNGVVGTVGLNVVSAVVLELELGIDRRLEPNYSASFVMVTPQKMKHVIVHLP